MIIKVQNNNKNPYLVFLIFITIALLFNFIKIISIVKKLNFFILLIKMITNINFYLFLVFLINAFNPYDFLNLL